MTSLWKNRVPIDKLINLWATQPKLALKCVCSWMWCRLLEGWPTISELQDREIVLVKCERKFDELEIPDGSNSNPTITLRAGSDFEILPFPLECKSLQYFNAIFADRGQIMFKLKLFCSLGGDYRMCQDYRGFLLAHLLHWERLNRDWFWLPTSFLYAIIFLSWKYLATLWVGKLEI